MDNETHGFAPLPERIRDTLACSEPLFDRADEFLAFRGSIAEWRALEALVSAGEEALANNVARLAMKAGADQTNPETWTAAKARGYAEHLVMHIASSVLARKNFRMGPETEIPASGAAFEWAAMLRLAELAVEEAPQPITDPDQVPTKVRNTIICRALKELATIAGQQGKPDRMRAYGDAAHDLENHPASSPAPASITAVTTSAIPSTETLAAAIRVVAGMKEMHPASRSMLEMIAGQVADLPTVTITHHSST